MINASLNGENAYTEFKQNRLEPKQPCEIWPQCSSICRSQMCEENYDLIPDVGPEWEGDDDFDYHPFDIIQLMIIENSDDIQFTLKSCVKVVIAIDMVFKCEND